MLSMLLLKAGSAPFPSPGPHSQLGKSSDANMARVGLAYRANCKFICSRLRLRKSESYSEAPGSVENVKSKTSTDTVVPKLSLAIRKFTSAGA